MKVQKKIFFSTRSCYWKIESKNVISFANYCQNINQKSNKKRKTRELSVVDGYPSLPTTDISKKKRSQGTGGKHGP